MEIIKVTKEIENPLFKRKEIQLEVSAEITPSKTEVDKLLSEKYSSNPDKIRIKRITGNFGSKRFKIEANLYESEEEMYSIERFSKKEKIAKAKEPAPEPVKEEVKEEKLAKESIEEVNPEENKE